MARTLDQSQPVHSNQATPSSHTDSYTLDIINLNNLLTRLEQNIFLSSSAEYKLLQQSHLHCARIGANVDYAQTLIKKIERSLPSVKAPAIRHERTTDLTKKRARYEKIRERFDGIKEEAERRIDREDDHDIDEIGEEDDDDDDDIWEGIIPVSVSKERRGGDDHAATMEIEDEAEVRNDITTSPGETSNLRQRRSDKTTSPVTPSSTTVMASGTSTSTSTLPKPGTTTTTAAVTSPVKTADSTPDSLPQPQPLPPLTDAKEAVLSTHRTEQENLTTSLLNLASQLKSSSEAFQTSLENEKGILNRAVEGLDRNLTGMEAAGKRMGVLRRMTEGRGWWGRMIMYAWIFALWLVALAIVYLGPKLRF